MKIELLTPEIKSVSVDELSALSGSYELELFDARAISWLNHLSMMILRDKVLNADPSFVALAYWIRKSNMNKLKEDNSYLYSNPGFSAEPQGLVFHICPSNVDTMFIYSLVLSLLTGNRNILRISRKMENSLVQYFFGIMNRSLAEHEDGKLMSGYVNVIQYDRNDEVNEYFTSKASARMIWGGDQTIISFRKLEGNARVKDIVFADRISAALINADGYLSMDDKSKNEVIRLFRNDAYVFDQKGCSSPQHVFFVGEKQANQECRSDFFSRVIQQNEFDKESMFSLASLKYNQAIDDVLSSKISLVEMKNNAAVMVYLEENNSDLHTCGGGYFYVHEINNVLDIQTFISDKVQTISYAGFHKNDIEILRKHTYGKSPDRLVPFGQALSFDYIWDGYNILAELTRFKKN